MDNTKRYERLLERYRNGDLDRRSFLGLIGAAGLAYGVQTPFARLARAQEVQQVRFDGWGGVVSEAFREHAFDPYTEETGIEVVDGTFRGVTNTSRRSAPASRAPTMSRICRACSTMPAT